MKNPQEMNNTKLIEWLSKTANSLSNASGANAAPYRKETLVDRFEELSDEAKERKIWEKWCDGRFCSVDHDGWDYFA